MKIITLLLVFLSIEISQARTCTAKLRATSRIYTSEKSFKRVIASENVERLSITFNGHTDTLCFGNSEFPGKFLGKLANKTGACQGMVGVVNAARNHITFASDASANSQTLKQIRRIFKEAIVCEKRKCSGTGFTIYGYSSLDDFCKSSEENYELLQRTAVSYNAWLGSIDIFLGKFRSFFATGTLDETRKREIVRKTISSIEERTRRNRGSMMLYKNHVVLVTGLNKVYKDGALKEVQLLYQDPNFFGTTNTMSIEFLDDGLPSVRHKYNQRDQLIWDITRDPTDFPTW